jgi:hypothetical protein
MIDNGALCGEELTAVVALHDLGAGLLVLSGWQGGELVYHHHLGVTQTACRSRTRRHDRVSSA